MIKKIKDNIFQLHFREFGSTAYVLKLEKNILIDTSTKENANEFIEDLKKLKIKPEEIDIILLTHTHWDHNGNLDLFSNAKIYTKENIKELNIPEIKIIKTPGHSEDSLCFLYENVLFSGDTIFHYGGRGRTDFPGGSEEQILESIEKLSKIDYKILCPGHV